MFATQRRTTSFSGLHFPKINSLLPPKYNTEHALSFFTLTYNNLLSVGNVSDNDVEVEERPRRRRDDANELPLLRGTIATLFSLGLMLLLLLLHSTTRIILRSSCNTIAKTNNDASNNTKLLSSQSVLRSQFQRRLIR